MKKILSLLLVFALALGVLVACKPNDEPDPQPQVTYDLDGAAAYVEGLYKEELSKTSVDFRVVSQVMIAGVKYQVEWSVDTDKVTVSEPENYVVTIDVDELSPEQVDYKLTATIKAGDGTSKQVSFNLTVPAFSMDDVNTHEDYMNAKKDDELTIIGIVTAINSIKLGNKYNHLFLKDTTVDGGYYCYKVTEDPEDLGVKVGMTVKVSGKMSPYNGMQEISGGQVAIIDSSIKTVEPLDITAQFTAGADLGAYVGLPVVIKGVEIGEQDLVKDTSQYLYFSIGEEQGYVRTYVTDFPAGMLTADDKATIDADHAAHFGYKADAAGILVLYSGAPYLIPMSVTPFTNYVEQIKTPAEKVEAELGGVKIDASFSADAVIELPAVGQYYNDVTLTYAVDDTTGAAVVADGKLTITVPNAKLVVKLTVTATCGETTDSKTIEITLSKSATPLKDLVALGESMQHNTYTEVKYVAAGVITEVKNDSYGNLVIADESGASLLIYGTFINGTKYGESTEYKPVVGDYVVVCGPVGQYNGTAQIKNADILSSKTPDALKDVAAAGAAQDHNTYTENPFLVTGVVTNIANAQYGNLYLKDAEGNELYFYGLYDQTGARFDAMANAPAVGDTITVLGPAGQYNGTAQVKNGTLVCVIKGTTDVECEHTYTDGVCTKCGEADPNYVPGGDTPAVNGVELTVNSLALPSDSYTAGTVTVNGVPFEFVQMGNYGDGIQMRDKDGKTSIIWNTAAFTKAIAKIELVFSDSKSTYDNADAVIFSFGNAADSLTYTTKLSTVAGTKTYTITPDAETYTFFKMEHDLSYTMYWKSITIVYVDGTTEGGDTPVECEHTYTDGVCTKCGEADPNYVPPTTDPEVVTTIAGALSAEVGAAVEITGTVSEFYQGWNTQYNNCSPYIVDEDGNRIIVFRCKTAVNVGDVISVVGVIGQYNNVNQVAEGSTVTIVTAHVCSTFTEADCLNAPQCTVCGKVNGEALGHNYVDGTCTACGATQSVGTITASKLVSDLITELGWTSSTTKQTFTLDDNVTVKINGGNNTGKAYNGDHIRIYATDSPAGTITITVPEGYELVSVKITAVTGTYAYLQIDGVDATDICNNTTAVSGSSVVLNSVKNGSDGKQVRVTAIEVVYKSVEA